MKTLQKIITILVSIMFINAYAQGQYIKDGDNLKDEHIDKFVGTWVWENGKDRFEIILKKDNVKLIPSANISGDVLFGFHKYVKNGKVIENSMNFANTNFNDKKSTLLGGTVRGGSTDVVKMGIHHKSKNKSVNAYIKYIDSKHIKIEKIENLQGLKPRSPSDKPFDPSISLPQDIILTKK